MSGGSFEYLCYFRDRDGPPLDTMREMAAFLRKHGHADAADATLALVDRYEEWARDAEALTEIWHDAEWWESGDMGPEQLADSVNQWRAKRKPSEPCGARPVTCSRGATEP